MFLYRDEYYNEQSEDQGLAEVILAKHRNGPIGTEKLAFLKRFAKFADLAPQPRREGGRMTRVEHGVDRTERRPISLAFASRASTPRGQTATRFSTPSEQRACTGPSGLDADVVSARCASGHEVIVRRGERPPNLARRNAHQLELV